MANTSQPRMVNYPLEVFVQKYPNTPSTYIDIPVTSQHHNLTPASINAVIDVEMKKVMANYAAEEDTFVDQKLMENPVICDRHSSSRSENDSNSSNRDPLQQQKADACRRSRIKNKIKKAKSKFRHKFITIKLAQNAATLACIRDVIAHAEAKLRSNGISEATLQKMRSTMGVDRMEIDNLSKLTKLAEHLSEN